MTRSDTAPAPAGANLLTNPGMSDGAGQATGWTAVWSGSGKVLAARDTGVWKEGPASLRVASEGGAAKGSVSQAIEGMGGTRLRCSGWLRSGEGTVASVGVGCFDAAWKLLSWKTIVALEPGRDWTAFEGTVDIPAEAAHVNLSAGIEGEGQAWFDELVAGPPSAP